MIRRLEAAEETSQERLVKKHVPAWVASGAIHVAIIAVAILLFGSRVANTKPSEKILTATAEKQDDVDDKNLTTEEIGVESNLPAALDLQRVEDKTVDEVVTKDIVGQPSTTEENPNATAPPGIGADFSAPGAAAGESGTAAIGDGGRNGLMSAATAGRSGATKVELLKAGGGNKESEAAVARGLNWLSKQQYYKKPGPGERPDPLNGSWAFDQGKTEDRNCATGLALLPFLAAGVTHKKKEDKDFKGYDEVVLRGLEYLKRNCPMSGATPGKMSNDVYANAIAALPLAEAYGMTKDSDLKRFVQATVNYIVKTQGPNGSWGYGNRGNGDTSIVGWQIQTLKAAKLAKDIVVPDSTFERANKFLELAGAGSRKAMYGYRDNSDAQPGHRAQRRRAAVPVLHLAVGAGARGPERGRRRADEAPASRHRADPRHVLLLLRHAGRPLRRGQGLAHLERRAGGGRRAQARHARLAHQRPDPQGHQHRELGSRGRLVRQQLRAPRHYLHLPPDARGVLPPPAALQARRRRQGATGHRVSGKLGVGVP